MSVIRVGSTSRYAEGWGAVFGGAAGPQGRGKKAVAKKAKPAKKAAKTPKKVVTKARKPGKSRRG